VYGRKFTTVVSLRESVSCRREKHGHPRAGSAQVEDLWKRQAEDHRSNPPVLMRY
jgi:hypothetical protein